MEITFRIGESIAHVRASETLTKGLEASGFYSKKDRFVGRGGAVGNWVSKGGESYAFVKIDSEGNITLSTAVADTGPGAYTIMRQIVAQELNVGAERITVELLDTTQVLKDTGVRGSSSTRVHGGSAYDAGTRARSEILRIAGAAMQASPEELILYEGGVTHSRAERRMSFGEIALAAGGAIIGEGHYMNMKEGPETSTVAQFAEVQVDPKPARSPLPASLPPTIPAPLNPMTHQGQIDGAVASWVLVTGRWRSLRPTKTAKWRPRI